MLNIKVEHIFLNFPEKDQIILTFFAICSPSCSRDNEVLHTWHGRPTIEIEDERLNLIVPFWFPVDKIFNLWWLIGT